MITSPAFELYPIETLRQLIEEISARYGDKPALKSRTGNGYAGPSYRELGGRIKDFSNGLSALDLPAGCPVAIIGSNSTEWAVSYLAVVGAGRLVVPIDRDLKAGEVRYILAASDSVAAIASGSHLELVLQLKEQLPSLGVVISMQTERAGADRSFDEVTEAGRAHSGWEAARPRPNDLAALIFTSGTTGSAKGVLLTHRNIASNVVGTSHHVAIDRQDVLLSVLPLHHTYECTAGFLTALYQGATICYAENLRRLADNLVEVRASVMLGVPALFESIYARIEKGLDRQPAWKRRLAGGVIRGAGLFGVDLRRRVFASLHERFGGRLRLLISGGAAINPAVSEGFRQLGIDLVQGYGMTEHAPIVAVNRVGESKDASVGLPLPSAEVRIVDDEILVKGPSVMAGYYRDQEATDETLRAGWLHTGDLGYFDDDGFLFISGRRKSVIVTPNGKNVYPEEVEFVLNQGDFIFESIVWGGLEQDPSLTEVQAILVPDRERFDAHFGAGQYGEAQVDDVLGQEVKRCNAELAGYKRIKRFEVREVEFEKTTTRKIKRYLYTTQHRSPPTPGEMPL